MVYDNLHSAGQKLGHFFVARVHALDNGGSLFPREIVQGKGLAWASSEKVKDNFVEYLDFALQFVPESAENKEIRETRQDRHRISHPTTYLISAAHRVGTLLPHRHDLPQDTSVVASSRVRREKRGRIHGTGGHTRDSHNERR